MLKTLFASLLAGGLLLLAGLYAASPSGARGAAPRALPLAAGKLLRGAGEYRGGEYRLKLDESGQAVLVLPAARIGLDRYPYLELAFAGAPRPCSLELLWETVYPTRQFHRVSLRHAASGSLWLDMAGTDGWGGDAASLAVHLSGDPGGEVALRRAVLEPASFAGYLRAVVGNWTAFTPWNATSVNLHAGVARLQSAVYPVPLAAALFACSAAAYALWLRLGRRRGARFDARVVAGLFLASWVLLDLAWQAKLLRQLDVTHAQFAGRTPEEKLRAGPDGALYGFIREARPLIDAPGARVFVGSAREYLAMRGAYFLYPLNVFWQRFAPELPARRYLARGDYLVVLEPSELRFDAGRGVLSLPDGSPLAVQTLLARPQGRLYRVL